MSDYKPTIIILGATGILGAPTIRALTSETFIHKYSLPIRVITRSPDKIKKEIPAAADPAIIKFVSADVVTGSGIAEAFDGIDVVINLLGVGSFDHNKIADAAAAAKVKLYIPSQFGTDTELAGPYKPIFVAKTEYINHIKSLGLKYTDIITGPFAEYMFTVPDLSGVNSPEPGKLQYYGDFDLKIGVTAVADIGKTIASVVSKDPATIPSKIRIYSGMVSPRIIMQLYKQVTGQELEPVGLPLEIVKEPALKVAQKGVSSMADFFVGLRGAVYDGGLYVPPVENEFVSKGLFKFTPIEEVAKQVFTTTNI
jgi:uncharacterized protein YbjT (DUF2867 family)